MAAAEHEAAEVVIHVMRLINGMWCVCRDDGSRVFYCRARGKQAAARKWQEDSGVTADRMICYRDRFRSSELAATLTDMKYEKGSNNGD